METNIHNYWSTFHAYIPSQMTYLGFYWCLFQFCTNSFKNPRLYQIKFQPRHFPLTNIIIKYSSIWYAWLHVASGPNDSLVNQYSSKGIKGHAKDREAERTLNIPSSLFVNWLPHSVFNCNNNHGTCYPWSSDKCRHNHSYYICTFSP